LELSENLGFDGWRQLGERLAQGHTSLQWWLGDWWQYGSRFNRRDEIAALFGLEPHTIENYAAVCRRFDVSRRRERLTFSHHAEVASMDIADEQDELLDWCEETLPATGRPRSRAALRHEVSRRRQAIWQAVHQDMERKRLTRQIQSELPTPAGRVVSLPLPRRAPEPLTDAEIELFDQAQELPPMPDRIAIAKSALLELDYPDEFDDVVTECRKIHIQR
jgi:hypothetical protein